MRRAIIRPQSWQWMILVSYQGAAIVCQLPAAISGSQVTSPARAPSTPGAGEILLVGMRTALMDGAAYATLRRNRSLDL